MHTKMTKSNLTRQSKIFNHPSTIKNLISIIIPAYNAEKFIANCIDSLLSQSYPLFEVIIINDGSTDQTLSIIECYNKKDHRIHYVTIENGGVSKARNIGLSLAQGEFIQFVDADDRIDLDYLHSMINLIQSSQADVALCQFEHPILSSHLKDEFFDLSKKSDFITLYHDTLALVVPWNKLWRRTCITSIFDETVHFAEDELFNLANICNAKSAITTNKKMYHYSVSEHSCVNSAILRDIQSPSHNHETLLFSKIAILQEKRNCILQYAFDQQLLPLQDLHEISHFRIIDFYFWHITLYFYAGATTHRIISDCTYIVQQAIFKRAFELKKSLGFNLNVEKIKSVECIQQYIRQCELLFAQYKDYPDLHLTHMFRTLFFYQFVDQTQSHEKYDLDVTLQFNRIHHCTREGQIVAHILS